MQWPRASGSKLVRSDTHSRRYAARSCAAIDASSRRVASSTSRAASRGAAVEQAARRVEVAARTADKREAVSLNIYYLLKYITQYLGKSSIDIKSKIESNLVEVNKIINNIKIWFYNNIEKWCVGDPYKLQSILHEYKNKKVGKLYLIVKNEKETSNYLKYSFSFKKGMPIIYQNYNDAKYYCLGKVLWSSSDNILKQQYGKFYVVYIDINDQR